MYAPDEDIKEIDKDNEPKIWHCQQEVILKEWGEIAASYRWLHNRSHKKFRRQNIAFTLPVIILSTIAGTANFSQGSFSGKYAVYVPLIIGAINLIAGLMTTIAEFLKVSELSENHRSSSLFFGKLSRNIKVELSLPWAERSSHGRDFLKLCRNDMDRLLEQSASIPNDVVMEYEKKFGKSGLYKPEILEIHKVSVYNNSKEVKEEHIGKIVANAAGILSLKHKNNSLSETMGPVLDNLKTSVEEANKSITDRMNNYETNTSDKLKNYETTISDRINSCEIINNITTDSKDPKYIQTEEIIEEKVDLESSEYSDTKEDKLDSLIPEYIQTDDEEKIDVVIGENIINLEFV